MDTCNVYPHKDSEYMYYVCIVCYALKELVDRECNMFLCKLSITYMD